MTDFKPWTPPPGAVVDPPVHPETAVDVIYSDGGRSLFTTFAANLNWSSEGDGPRVIAYAVVSEYVEPPKVAREWWLVGNGAGYPWHVIESPPACKWPISIHVREVLPAAREVVAWAVIVRGKVHNIWEKENVARSGADYHGGTVVKLTGVMP